MVDLVGRSEALAAVIALHAEQPRNVEINALHVQMLGRFRFVHVA